MGVLLFWKKKFEDPWIKMFSAENTRCMQILARIDDLWRIRGRKGKGGAETESVCCMTHELLLLRGKVDPRTQTHFKAAHSASVSAFKLKSRRRALVFSTNTWKVEFFFSCRLVFFVFYSKGLWQRFSCAQVRAQQLWQDKLLKSLPGSSNLGHVV